MQNLSAKIGGFVILTLGVVGYIVYPTSEDVPVLEENQVVQEIKAEESNISSEIVPCMDGLTCKISYFKTYVSEDGAMRDTPKAGYTLVIEKSEMITQTSIIETEEEKEARLAAYEVEKAEQKIKNDNDALYRRIGELEVLKLGGKPDQDAKILELQSKLQ